MSPELKITASIIAIGISFVAYIPYILGMFRGTNKPHIYSWTSILIITAVVGYLQLVGGAGIGAWPTLLGALVYLAIVVLCFRYGTRDIVLADKLCLSLSILGVAAYVVLRDVPNLALIIVTVAELIGFLPTWRKTRNSPYSESLSSYYFLVTKMLLIVVAIESYNFLTLANTLIWLVVMVAFIGSTLFWRASTTDAPSQSSVKS